MKQARLVYYIFYWIIAGSPVFVWAKTVKEITEIITREIIKPFIAFLFVAATVVFLWGIIEMLANSDNEDARSTGRTHVIWGLVGLFIMLAAITIIKVICATFQANCPAIIW